MDFNSTVIASHHTEHRPRDGFNNVLLGDAMYVRAIAKLIQLKEAMFGSSLAYAQSFQSGRDMPGTDVLRQPLMELSHAKGFISDANIGERLGLTGGSVYADGWSSPVVRDLVHRPVHVMMLGLRGFPNVQGGVESHVEQLAPLLVSQGCKVEVIVRSPYQDPNVGPQWHGVSFTSLWAPKSKGLEAVLHTLLGVLYAAIKRPDILHIHAIGPAIWTPLARLLGLKVVVTHHGPDYQRQKWGVLARTILKTGEWVGMRFSNARIVISNTIRELVIQKHTVHAELILNGVVIPQLSAHTKVLNELGVEAGRYVLLVSRLVPEKRHLDLIRAFHLAKVSGYKLVLVGSSDHPDAYVQSVLDAAQAHEGVVLAGFRTGDELASLYSHAALFVLPSSHEGLSISLLEALSYGLPVLASDIPANLEVGLNAGDYFALGDVEALACKIREKFANPLDVRAKQMLREWVAHRYDWHDIAQLTVREYVATLRER